MVSDGLAPRLAETVDAVDDVQPGVAEDPVPAVDDPVLGVGPDRDAAEEVRRHRRAGEVRQLPPGSPPITAAIRRTASLPAGIQVGLGSPCPCRLVSRHAEEPSAAGHDQASCPATA